MHRVSHAAEPSSGIRLGHEPAFWLGPLAVTPSTRQVQRGGARETLEPRVMQVLVALARKGGEVVSRDALIDQCWEGRVVGENAINRVIAQLRRLSTGLGADCFEIGTITKVGYRLLASGKGSIAHSVRHPQSQLVARRTALTGAGALVVAGSLGWVANSAPSSRAQEARRFLENGRAELATGDYARLAQAAAYFEHAVDRAPRLAEAWGALALVNQQMVEWTPEDRHDDLFRRSQDAAARALALDPDNRDALVARALGRPMFRNWLSVDRHVRAGLSRVPASGTLRNALSLTFLETGRWRAAARAAADAVEQDALIPNYNVNLAYSLWQSGALDEARRIYERTFGRWPNHTRVWLSFVEFLSFERATADALRLTKDQRVLTESSPLSPELAATCAIALGGVDPAARAQAIRAVLNARAEGAIATFVAVPYLSAFGAIDDAYDQCYAYFLGKRDPASGERAGLISSAMRHTDFLFVRSTVAMRADSRFAKLIGMIGLDDYWSATGSRPDFA